jgi:hypothetical protein
LSDTDFLSYLVQMEDGHDPRRYGGGKKSWLVLVNW